LYGRGGTGLRFSAGDFNVPLSLEVVIDFLSGGFWSAFEDFTSTSEVDLLKEGRLGALNPASDRNEKTKI